MPTRSADARSRRLRAALTPYLYLAPALILLGLFVYWPLVHNVYLSLVSWNLNPDQPIEFVGFENYAAVTGSTLFEQAALNTAIYIAASIPLKVIAPIPIAVFLWSLGERGQFYRAVLFLPTLLSFVAVSIAFLWILNPIFGYAQQALAAIGIALPNLLSDPDTAIWTIIAISSWKVLGFNVLIYLAGLASIPRDYIEAMRLDGAGDVRIFRSLILPLLSPTMLFVLIATVIFTVQQVFTPIDILTAGGPSNSTNNLFYLVYQYTFLTFDVGAGAAGTAVLFALLMLVTALKLAALDRRVHYQQ